MIKLKQIFKDMTETIVKCMWRFKALKRDEEEF